MPCVWATSWHAVLMPWHVMPFHAASCHAVPCRINAMPPHVMPHHSAAVPCHAVLPCRVVKALATAWPRSAVRPAGSTCPPSCWSTPTGPARQSRRVAQCISLPAAPGSIDGRGPKGRRKIHMMPGARRQAGLQVRSQSSAHACLPLSCLPLSLLHPAGHCGGPNRPALQCEPLLRALAAAAPRELHVSCGLGSKWMAECWTAGLLGLLLRHAVRQCSITTKDIPMHSRPGRLAPDFSAPRLVQRGR